MSQTNISSASPQANKQYSKALSAMATRAITPLTSMTGPMPSHSDAMKKLKTQTTPDMPVVRVDELSKGPGDKVQVDCAQVVQLRAIMGDANAEGQGAPLKYSSQEFRLDMATLPVSAGGTMSQQRLPHDLRENAVRQLAAGMPRFRFQRALVHLAGARGVQAGNDWIVPLSTDGDFANQMVNTVQAPTYNRHWVVNGTALTQGGAQLASAATTDQLKLSHVDELAALWDEMGTKMSPIQIPGDPAAADDPIKGILFVDPLVWDALIRETTSGYNLRTFEQNAMKRAAYGDLAKHPLFSGAPLMWNGILIRKMSYAIRFNASDSVAHVTSANRLTATETNVTVAAGLSTTHQVARSLFLGAQALAMVSGGNKTSEETYSLLENRTNFGRNLELAGEIMGAEGKFRFNLPNSSGVEEPTDFGVAVIDSVVLKRNV
jgi:hypothetical protein